MALSAKWLDGDLIFYDGTQEVYRIKNSTEGVVVGESDAEVPVTLYGDVTFQEPTTTVSTGSTGTVTLTTTSNRVQFISNSTGGDCVVTLPPTADCAGIEFKFANTSSTGTVTVKTTGDSTVATMPVGAMAITLCDGTNWGAMKGHGSTY